MARESIYVHPAVIKQTMELLKTYKRDHPKEVMPVWNCCKDLHKDERVRFIRAAKRLGWAITETQGNVYENGRLWQ